MEIKDTTAIYKKAIIAHEKNVPLIETVGGLKAAFGKEMFLEAIPETEVQTEDNKASVAARKYFKSLWKDNPFPYLAAPIQNGPAHVIIDDEGTVDQTQDFPDCVEVAIRHFFNIILYTGWESGTFNYQNLDIANGKSDFFKDFYTKQHNRDLANNSSINLRTDWNKVMCNIPEVIYRMKNDGKRIADIKQMKPYQPKEELPGNEIKAGIINLYNVLAYLLWESQIPTDKKDVVDSKDTMTRYEIIKQFYESKGDSKGELSKALAKKFNTLLSKFNHESSYEATIDFHSLDKNNNAGEQEPDLYGNIEIFKNQNKLLTLEMQNGHGLLTLNLKELPKAEIKETHIAKNPVLLLLPTGKLLTNYQTTYPYYASFHSNLTFCKNEESEISYNKDRVDSFTFDPAEDEIPHIRSFVAQTEGNNLVGQSVKDYFKFFLYKLEIYDKDTSELNSEETKQLLDNIANDHDDNRKYVKKIGIYNDHSKNTNLLQNLNKFENLESIEIKGGTIELNTLKIDNCQKLKEIKIRNMSGLSLRVAGLNITNCPKLESLNIGKGVANITIDNCPELKTLTLPKNSASIAIIKKCPKLDKEMLTLDTEKHTITLDGEKLKNN